MTAYASIYPLVVKYKIAYSVAPGEGLRCFGGVTAYGGL